MTTSRLTRLLSIVALAGCVSEDLPGPAARPPVSLEPIGQYGDHHVIYVPAYSHVYHDDSPLRFALTATLSVHNISFRDSIWVHKIRYYDTDGKLVRSFLKEPVAPRPMQTYKVRVTQKDTTRGVGANFLVEWEAQPHVPAPIAEAVHIAVTSTVGLSFVTRGNRLTPPIIPDTLPQP